MKYERWGVKVIDNQLKGLESNGKTLLYGGAGFDLLAFQLTFLASGLKLKQRAAIVTSEDPSEILRNARHIGLDLEKDLQKDNFIIIRCKPFLGEKLIQLGTSDRMLQEIRQMIGTPLPERIAFYPLSSFVSESNPDSLMKSTEFFISGMKRIRSTVMLAEPERDRNRDLYLIQEAKKNVDLVLKLNQSKDDTREIIVEKDTSPESRNLSWVYFVQKGVGIQAVESENTGVAAEDYDPSSQVNSRTILLISDDPEEISSLKGGLEPIFRINLARSETEAMSQLLNPRFGLILVAFGDDERGQAFCRYIRTQRIKHPLVLMGNQKRRAWERASVLLQGVDDFIPRPYSQVELISRLSSIIRRSSFGFPFEEIAEYIGAQKRLWQKLKKLPKDDPNTGLSTYKYFSAALEHELFKAKMVGYPCGILILRSPIIHNFSAMFNEGLGTLIRDTDFVTVLPSGTYALFLGAGGMPELSMFLERLRNFVRKQFPEQDLALEYSTALYPKDATDGDSLLNLATSRVQDVPTRLI